MELQKTFATIVATCLLFAVPGTRAATPSTNLEVNIPFKKFVLKNGLTLIVQEDHKAPIVAIDLWYHVGSKNEKPGKTGFAHLFEHLMFTGSEHLKGEGNQRAFYETMERIGGSDANGTTSRDRTDFFETVPTNALDVVLWVESDRMGHLLETIDQTRLDKQRGVVQNEKRQGENQPYGKTRELLAKGAAPPGHPYSWTPIGSMEDLNAASLEDVQNWFKTYYGAANVVLVLAGDIDSETARAKVEHYFGDIPAGPPVERYHQWIPEIHGTRRQVLSDRVPQARVYEVWNIPGYGEPDNDYLSLVGNVLSSGKTSRLYKRLVYDEQLATDVSVEAWPGEISGSFSIEVTARPGIGLSRIEKIIDEELAKFRSKGPTAKELARSQTTDLAAFVRSTERAGGFGGRADILAMNQTFRDDPGYYETVLKHKRDATISDLQNAAQQWLNGDVYILEVQPYPDFETTSNNVDRSHLPQPAAPAESKFPAFQRATLSNGLKVILGERHSVPLVSVSLQVDAGTAADQSAAPGTARLMLEMLDEGTSHRNALEISDDLEALGASLSTGFSFDSSTIELSALASTLDSALDVYADVILNPSFPEPDFERLQKQALARIQSEKTEPFRIGLRILPQLLYGRAHAYGTPGSGTEQGVAGLKRADLQKFYAAWFKPNHATLIIVGDTTLATITPKLEKLFSQWKPGSIPKKNIETVGQKQKTAIYLVDRPDSIQSMIVGGQVAPPRADPDEIPIEIMNMVLGGAFTSRIDMNLREQKHWSYGAHSFLWQARGQRPFVIFAPVQTDKTKDALVELNRELQGILGEKPISAEELVQAQKNETLSLPRLWETDDDVASYLGQIAEFGLSDDYFATYPEKVRSLSLTNVSQAAQKVLHPDQVVWVVVGDRSKIEAGLSDLGWGAVQILDTDGNPVK